MTLPQRNATLLKVTARGTTVDWDSPDLLGASKFEGRAPAYYTERKERGVTTATGSSKAADLVRRRYVIVEPGIPDIDFEEDDVLEVLVKTRHGERTVIGAIATTDERDLPGQPVYGTVRIALKVE